MFIMTNRKEKQLLQGYVNLLDKIHEFGAETDAETTPAILKNVFDFFKEEGASWASAENRTYTIVRKGPLYAMRRSICRALGHHGVKKPGDVITDDIRSALLEPHQRILAYFGDEKIWIKTKLTADGAESLEQLAQRVDKVAERLDKVAERVDKLAKRVDKLTRAFWRERRERRKDHKALMALINELRAGRASSVYSNDGNSSPVGTSSGALPTANMGLPTTYAQPVASTSDDAAYEMIMQGEFLE